MMMYISLFLLALHVAVGWGCTSTQFACDDGECIPSSWQCDVVVDCNDGSDEAYCPTTASTNTPCPSYHYQCATTSECYSFTQQCDGYFDCSDGSDELDCATECVGSELACSYSSGCYSLSERCDSVPDCNDASDEAGCSTTTIDYCTYYQCDDGRCLSGDWGCDGVKDCSDGSDELNCDSANLGLILGLSIPFSIMPFIPMIVMVVVCHYRKKRRLRPRRAPVITRVVPVQRGVIVVRCGNHLRQQRETTPGGSRFVDGSAMGGGVWIDAPPVYTATADPAETTIVEDSASPLPPPYSMENPSINMNTSLGPQESLSPANNYLSPPPSSNLPVSQSPPKEEEDPSLNDDNDDRSPLLQQ